MLLQNTMNCRISHSHEVGSTKRKIILLYCVLLYSTFANDDEKIDLCHQRTKNLVIF